MVRDCRVVGKRYRKIFFKEVFFGVVVKFYGFVNLLVSICYKYISNGRWGIELGF